MGKVTLAYFSFLCVYIALRLDSIVVKLLAFFYKKILDFECNGSRKAIGAVRGPSGAIEGKN